MCCDHLEQQASDVPETDLTLQVGYCSIIPDQSAHLQVSRGYGLSVQLFL